MRYLLTALIACIVFSDVAAQNKWEYLPNVGLVKGAIAYDSIFRIEDIYFTDTLTGYAVTLRNHVLKTTDGCNTWRVINDTTLKGSGQFRSIEFLDDGLTGFAASLGLDFGGGYGLPAQVFMTTDSGHTWTDIAARIPDTLRAALLPRSMCGMGHYKNNVYGVGFWGSDTGRFYKSTDKGATWTVKLLDTSLIRNVIDVVFLSADTGFITGAKGKYAVVAKTTDGGSTWSRVFADSIIGGRIWKIQHVSGDVMVGSIEGRFAPDTACMIYSKDRGNTWQVHAAGRRKPIKTNGLRGTQGVGFVNPGLGWLGGYYDGVFETTDSGKTWAHINFGYDFNRIFVIDSAHVFAGGHWPYRYRVVDTTKPNDTTNTSVYRGTSKFANVLYPVSPNPSKGKVKIEFELKAPSNVLLEVINLGTREMYRLVNTSLTTGKHTYYWDGSNMPDGQYMVWFDNNEMPQVCKFILLK